jgi:hypothetical protein
MGKRKRQEQSMSWNDAINILFGSKDTALDALANVKERIKNSTLTDKEKQERITLYSSHESELLHEVLSEHYADISYPVSEV